ncbi:phosphotransferase [Geomicrobium sp. JSM 1781026]
MTHFDMQTRVKRKKWLEMLLGADWNLEPAGGSTGEAFIAHDGSRKLFLKCNSSPFLAVLSAEGIVPKLLWTKRLANGDVITAQRWVYGRELSSTEMQKREVAELLQQIHASSDLLEMLKRIENQVSTPDVLLGNLKRKAIFQNNTPSSWLQDAFLFLEENKHKIEHDEFVVCHCDLNHNNWIMEKDDSLFLIDWDGASVADPALDLSVLLHWYVPKNKWLDWLSHYGLELDDSIKKRMHWYIVMHTVEYILDLNENDHDEVNSWKRYLASLLTPITNK